MRPVAADANLCGSRPVCKAAAPSLIERGGGTMVLVSSTQLRRAEASRR